jgi:hypothetical protein
MNDMNKTEQPSSANPRVPEQKPAPKFPRVRKIFRFLKYFIVSSVILTVIEIGIVYWLISSRWSLLVPKADMTEFAREINDTKPLPENFMRVYVAKFPNHYNTTLGQQVFINYGERYFFRTHDIDNKAHCYCDMIYDIQRLRNPKLDRIEWDGRLQDLEYGFGMEKYSTPEKCFEYVWHYKIDRFKAYADPRYYGNFLKPIESYTDDELIELILMLKQRGKMNRYDTPELFEKEFKEYKLKLASLKPN